VSVVASQLSVVLLADHTSLPGRSSSTLRADDVTRIDT